MIVPVLVFVAAVSLGRAESFSLLASAGVRTTGTMRVTGNVSAPAPGVTPVVGDVLPGSDALKDAAKAWNELAPSSDVAVSRLDSLITDPGSTKRVIGFDSSHTFWLVNGSATLGARSTFVGTLIAMGDIAVERGVTVAGRLIALKGAITLTNDDINLCCDPIELSPLPDGTAGKRYETQIAATGGKAPHDFSFFGDEHPDWLQLARNGTLSGTPPTPGRVTFTVLVEDYKGCTSIRTYSINVCGTPQPQPATVPDAVVGSAYSVPITSDAPSLFTSTTLPEGLTLTPATCTTTALLCGTPKKPGTYRFTITITSCDGGCIGSRDYTLVIRRPTITVLPETLRGGTVGIAYTALLTASGSLEPYRFEATASVPPGVIVAPSGALSFTPSVAGTYSFSVTATDSYGSSGSRNYAIDVCPAIAISPASLPDGMVNVPYSVTLGGGAYTFEAAELPSWLKLNNGVLSGTPSEPGDYPIIIVASAGGCSAEANYILHVSPCAAIVITPATLTRGTVGVPYDHTISVTASSPYTVQVTGSIPPGLSPPLHLFGIPMVAGVYHFTVTVTTACASLSQDYSVVIEAPSAPGAIVPALSPFALAMLAALLAAIGAVLLGRS